MACSGSTVQGVVDRLGAPNNSDSLRPFVPLLAGAAVLVAVITDPGTLPENVVAMLAFLPFVVWAWLWRGMPTLLLVGLAGAAQLVALASGELEPLLFLMCVAATVVGGWERSPVYVVVGGLAAAATPVVVETVHSDDILFGTWIMGIALSLLLPRGFRWQLKLTAELAVAREEIARQSALEEKRAIARDVHDLVGHGLAAVMLHVTGAQHVLRRDPDAAEEALADAQAVGRRSLQELRRTLGMLREEDGAAATPAPPVPDAGGLFDVVASARAAGLDAELRLVGDLGQVDPIVGLSLYRVVEEALANARQHAPRAVTDVELVVEEDAVRLTVESVGPVEPTEPLDAGRRRYGLVGMRERMAAVGGELEAGPTATGWRVRGHAPLTADRSESRSEIPS